MKRKIKKHLVYEGFGFPIHLLNVPMFKTRDTWIPDINYNILQKIVLAAIATKPIPLSGAEVRFIRKYFRMTLEAFGREFGVSHVAVIEWEKAEEKPVQMNPATEKCLRLFALDSLHISDEEFRKKYHLIEIKKFAFSQKRKQKQIPLKVDAQELLLKAG